jgi:hypothetical protein
MIGMPWVTASSRGRFRDADENGLHGVDPDEIHPVFGPVIGVVVSGSKSKYHAAYFQTAESTLARQRRNRASSRNGTEAGCQGSDQVDVLVQYG